MLEGYLPRCPSTADRQDDQHQQGDKSDKGLCQFTAAALEQGETGIRQTVEADRNEYVVRQKEYACEGKSASKPGYLKAKDLLHRKIMRKIVWKMRHGKENAGENDRPSERLPEGPLHSVNQQQDNL